KQSQHIELAITPARVETLHPLLEEGVHGSALPTTGLRDHLEGLDQLGQPHDPAPEQIVARCTEQALANRSAHVDERSLGSRDRNRPKVRRVESRKADRSMADNAW